jgi:two-component system phosphate regulon response regulator PhoB
MPQKKHVLIVDDEEDILELIRYNLSKEGFDVHCVTSGEEGLSYARKTHPDVIILDLMLPGVDGLDVCKQLKAERQTQDIPIIIVTAKGEEADVVLGLELGADDYISKPFSPRVVSARVKSVLRRRLKPSDTTVQKILKVDDLLIDAGRHEVKLKGRRLDLTLSEFKILQFLVSQRGWVFTRQQIVEAVHGKNYPVTDRSIDVQIVSLRRKLDKMGDLVETVRGVGYRFQSANPG